MANIMGSFFKLTQPMLLLLYKKCFIKSKPIISAQLRAQNKSLRCVLSCYGCVCKLSFTGNVIRTYACYRFLFTMLPYTSSIKEAFRGKNGEHVGERKR